MKEKELTIPVKEKEVRDLEMGDIVYLDGIIHTMRDMGHRRTLDLIEKGKDLPFNLENGAIWHLGPIVRKENDSWEIISAGPTTSSRFTDLGAKIIEKLNVRIIIGKGNMGKSAIDAMEKKGAAFLTATGGCAALYAEKVRRVKNAFWTDFGIPERIWVLEVNGLGPLTVGIDSNGNSENEELIKRVRNRLRNIYDRDDIDPNHDYAYIPRKVLGSRDK